jgi:hypothetical protein
LEFVMRTKSGRLGRICNYEGDKLKFYEIECFLNENFHKTFERKFNFVHLISRLDTLFFLFDDDDDFVSGSSSVNHLKKIQFHSRHSISLLMSDKN